MCWHLKWGDEEGRLGRGWGEENAISTLLQPRCWMQEVSPVGGCRMEGSLVYGHTQPPH